MDRSAHKHKIMAIDVPRKIWRPKVKSKYKPPLFNKDVDEGVFIFESLGAAVFRPKPWKPGVRNDFILFNEALQAKEFSAFKINKNSAVALLPTLMQILRAYWDCFVTERICRVILARI